ncbi:MAG: sulfotransferase, partial [Gammaproteobacteria bacterium]
MRSGFLIAFLLGVPRSGTTLLAALLNQHREILCPPEPWLLLGLDAIGQVPAQHVADSSLVGKALSEFFAEDRSEALRAAAEAIYQKALDKSGKTVFVDKTPRYYHSLDLVQAFLPQGRVIVLFRNPLDVAASYRESWNIDLPKLIEEREDSPAVFDYVLGFKRLIDFAEQNPVLTMHYENLVASTDSEMKRAFDFLGLSEVAVSSDLDLSLSDYARSSFGDRNILQHPIVHAGSVNRYKSVFSRTEIEVLSGCLGQNLFERLGYGPCYAEIARELDRNPPESERITLLNRVEHQVAQRQAGCQNPVLSAGINAVGERISRQLDTVLESHGALNRQIAAVQEQNKVLNQQIAELHGLLPMLEQQKDEIQILHTKLEEQKDHAHSLNAKLDEQRFMLLRRPLRDRIRPRFRFSRAALKHAIYL